jgi:hypothetical protein
VDDLTSGGDGDQMRESLQGNGIAVNQAGELREDN